MTPADTGRTGKSFSKWESTRKKGKWKFILVKGALLWGGAMFVVMGLVFPLVTNGANALTPRGLAVSLAVWLLGGLAWGVLMWLTLELLYRRREHPEGKHDR